jgi:MraZ protein
MLRGSYTARVDAKGRLKVPAVYRRIVEERWGAQVYITSLTGEYARIYPLPEWVIIEERLAMLPSMDPTKQKFLGRTNYYGQDSELDGQGRVLIHPLLRASAELMPETDATVLGYLTYLEVWNQERFQAHLAADPFTDDDAALLSRLGI